MGISGVSGYQWFLDEVANTQSSYFVNDVLDEEAVLGWEGNLIVIPSDGSGDVYERFLVGYQRERLLMVSERME